MATSDARAKVIALVETLRELDSEYADKRGAVMAELAMVLGGGEGIGPKLARLRATFAECWRVRYGSAYQFNFATDNAHLKRFLKTHEEGDVSARIFAYLKSSDPFYVRARHPFGLFVKGFNSFVPEQPAGDLDLSAASTADRLKELRGE